MPRRPGSPSNALRSTPPALLLAADHPEALVRERLRTGEWRRIRRGVYVPEPRGDAYEVRREIALARVAAVGYLAKSGLVVSHTSAALLWGLPLVLDDDRVHVVQQHLPSSRVRGDVVRHTAALGEGDVTRRHGLRVTTLERTLVDCASGLPPRAGLTLLDAGLRCGADRAAMEAMVQQRVGARGVRRARALIALADDGAESPGESETRWVLLRAGLPVPETQVEVTTHLGPLWADLGWREWRLLVEYDGRQKYEARGSASAVVLAEKRREEALREAGWSVVRVSAADLHRPDQLVERVARRLPSAGGRRTPRRHLAA